MLAISERNREAFIFNERYPNLTKAHLLKSLVEVIYFVSDLLHLNLSKILKCQNQNLSYNVSTHYTRIPQTYQ